MDHTPMPEIWVSQQSAIHMPHWALQWWVSLRLGTKLFTSLTHIQIYTFTFEYFTLTLTNWQTSHMAESCCPSRSESSQLWRLSMNSSCDCRFSIMCSRRASRSRAAASRLSSFSNADESWDTNTLCRRVPTWPVTTCMTNTHSMAAFQEQSGWGGTRKVKPFWTRAKDKFWTAVALAGSYVNNLHLVPNKLQWPSG